MDTAIHSNQRCGWLITETEGSIWLSQRERRSKRAQPTQAVSASTNKAKAQLRMRLGVTPNTIRINAVEMMIEMHKAMMSNQNNGGIT
jgi:hypothetical protein